MYRAFSRGKTVRSKLAYRYAALVSYQASSNPEGLGQPRFF